MGSRESPFVARTNGTGTKMIKFQEREKREKTEKKKKKEEEREVKVKLDEEVVVVKDGEDEEDEDSISLKVLESKFGKLAHKFRHSMHIYGLYGDVALLLADNQTQENNLTKRSSFVADIAALAAQVKRETERPQQQSGGSGWFRGFKDSVGKLYSLALVLTANFTIIYVLLAHFIWELRMLDAKSSSYDSWQEGASSKGWSVLKEFLENFRRHLSRVFSLLLILVWHASCRKIEFLFVDCRRYYAMFYKWSPAGATPEERREKRKELLEASSKFYKLARHRIKFALLLPLFHFIFNITSIVIFPHSNKRRTALANQNRLLLLQQQQLAANVSANLVSGNSLVANSTTNETNSTMSLLSQALDNFDSFHLAIHTAFHPFDHQIKKHTHPGVGGGGGGQVVNLSRGSGEQVSSTLATENTGGSGGQQGGQVSVLQSAVYCLIELFVYSLYFNGPRIICATCLSLVLNIHYQCIRQFNRQLMTYIKRGKERPLTSGDIVSMVKQYDLIGMMHEQIERTFKWSIVIWYSLMFVICLMHIFSFTESTSAYINYTSNYISSTAATSGAAQQLSLKQQQVLDNNNNKAIATGNWTVTAPPPPPPIISTSSTSSVALMFIRLTSVFFVCYSPYLIYSEAFKIESASSRAEQLLVRLAMRQDDPLAQSIEPTLFEPIYLSVGGYFDLSKKSMSSFLGAIVTFSVMFIAAAEDETMLGQSNGDESEPDTGGEDIGGDETEPNGDENDDNGETEDSNSNEISAEDDDDQSGAEASEQQGTQQQQQFELEQEEDNDDDDEPPAGENGQKQDEEEEEQGKQHQLGDAPVSGPLEEFAARAKANSERQVQSSTGVGESRLRAHSISVASGGRSSQQEMAPNSSEAQTGSGRSVASGIKQQATLLLQQERSAMRQQKAKQRRKYKRLNRLRLKQVEQQQQQQQRQQHEDQLRARMLQPLNSSAGVLTLSAAVAPKLEPHYVGRVRENERLVELTPKLRILNQVEVCDIELLLVKGGVIATQSVEQKLPFTISWIDRVNGEANLEARSEELMNCERQRNYTFLMRAIGCNGLDSNEALVSVTVEDVNEFSPEFERNFYSLTLDLDLLDLDPTTQQLASAATPAETSNSKANNKVTEDDDGQQLLLTVQARDQDCSAEFGSICSYELLTEQPAQQQQQPQVENLESRLSIDSFGRIRLRPAAAAQATSTSNTALPLKWWWSSLGGGRSKVVAPHGDLARRSSFTFQVIAYDCGGKKSQTPATVQVNLNKLCRPALKDVDMQIFYRPGSGQKSPFLRAQLDLCGAKCHRPNISVSLQLEATPSARSSSSEPAPQSTPGSNYLNSERRPSNLAVRTADSSYEPTTSVNFHCDRESYSIVSKRRLCGGRTRTIELLPPYSSHTKWIYSLYQSSSVSSSGSSSRGFVSRRPSDDDAGSELPSPSVAPAAAADDDERVSSAREQDQTSQVQAREQDQGEDWEETGKQEEEDSNLGAYTLDGSYGKRALEYIDSNWATEQEQESAAAAAAKTTPAQRGDRIGGGINGGRHHRHGQHQYRARKPHSRRSLPGDGSTYPGSRLSKQQQKQQRADKRSLDSSRIYRDQVYRFDGSASSVVVVPKAVYGAAPTNNNNNHHHRHHQYLPEAAAASSGGLGGQLPFLFGTKHTISFWMRHAPFRFNSASSSSSSTDRLAESAEQSGGRGAGIAGNSTGDDELKELGKHVKEHILCASSADVSHHHHHARHHYYGLFARNCKLILLMRRQLNDSRPTTNDSKTYMPAEWRWSLEGNKVCDNKWHLYTVNVNYPNVELYVDGQQFEENYDNLVIVDDLPLHSQIRHSSSSVTYQQEQEEREQEEQEPSRSQDKSGGGGATQRADREATSVDIVLSIGGCWDSRQQLMTGHFKGSLSGLSVLANDNDDSQIIECLGKCTEALVSTAQSASMPMMHDQQQERPSDGAGQVGGSGSKMDNSLVSYQESQSKILLNGHHFLDVEDALTQIAYTNSRLLPSIGKRSILVDTNIECTAVVPQQLASQVNQQVAHTSATNEQTPQDGSTSGSGVFTIPIEPIRVEVNVLPSKSLPVISISGTPNLAREYGPFMQGIRLFSSVSLRIKKLNLYHQSAASLSRQQQLFPIVTNRPQQQISNRSYSSSSLLAPNNEDADYIEDSVTGSLANGADVANNVDPQTEGFAPVKVQPVEQLGSIRRRIEACNIKVYPPLNGLHESLLLPIDQIDSLQLYWRQSHEGVIIYGLDSVENYERLVRSIVYRNQKPAYYLERLFKLICSDMNGRLVSNEYVQTVTIIHQKSGGEVTTLKEHHHHHHHQQEQQQDIQHGHQMEDSSGGGGGRLVVIEEDNMRAPPPLLLKRSEPLQVSQLQPLTMLNAEQSTRLDRIAIAFLVFVISLIVIMLVIALTNLKEPNIKHSAPSTSFYGHKHTVLEANGRSMNALSYDIDSSRSDDYYADDLEELDEEDQEEDNATTMVNGRRGEHTCAGLHSPRARIYRARGRSNSQTDPESLAWDDEELENEEEDDDDDVDDDDAESTVIVMNPILHGSRQRNQTTGDLYVRTLVTEQRPDRCGKMVERAKTHLSYHSPALTGGRPSSFIHEPPTGNVGHLETMLALDDVISNSCSSSSQSSSSSESGDDDGDNERNNIIRPCRHSSHHHMAALNQHPIEEDEEEEEEDESSSSDQHYELYHRHQHHQHHFHHHHTCLGQHQHSATHKHHSYQSLTSPVAGHSSSTARFRPANNHHLHLHHHEEEDSDTEVELTEEERKRFLVADCQGLMCGPSRPTTITTTTNNNNSNTEEDDEWSSANDMTAALTLANSSSSNVSLATSETTTTATMTPTKSPIKRPTNRTYNFH